MSPGCPDPASLCSDIYKRAPQLHTLFGLHICHDSHITCFQLSWDRNRPEHRGSVVLGATIKAINVTEVKVPALAGNECSVSGSCKVRVQGMCQGGQGQGAPSPSALCTSGFTGQQHRASGTPRGPSEHSEPCIVYTTVAATNLQGNPSATTTEEGRLRHQEVELKWGFTAWRRLVNQWTVIPKYVHSVSDALSRTSSYCC